jgi:hypothetical protein
MKLITIISSSGETESVKCFYHGIGGSAIPYSNIFPIRMNLLKIAYVAQSSTNQIRVRNMFKLAAGDNAEVDQIFRKPSEVNHTIQDPTEG